MHNNQQQGYRRGYGENRRDGYRQSSRDRWENRNVYNRGTNQTQWGRRRNTPSQMRMGEWRDGGRDNMGVNERQQCPPHFLELGEAI